MGGLGAETLGTETFQVSILVLVPKMSGIEKVSVSRAFIRKSRSRSDFMRLKFKVLVSVSVMRP